MVAFICDSFRKLVPVDGSPGRGFTVPHVAGNNITSIHYKFRLLIAKDRLDQVIVLLVLVVAFTVMHISDLDHLEFPLRVELEHGIASGADECGKTE